MDAAHHARITDFGLAPIAQSLDSTWSTSDDQGRTVRWAAPEILNGQGTYSKEADIFSLAMATIEVRCESIIRVELWLTAISYCRSCLLVRFLSTTHHLQQLCQK